MTAMNLWQPGATRPSRRTLLLASVGVSALIGAPAKGGILPADGNHYDDPTTEFEVRRLTQPSYSSYLPAWPGRAVSRRSEFAIVATDRTGSLQLQRLDLKSGQSRVLAPIGAPRAFTLSADDRTVYYHDQDSLFAVPIAGASRGVRLWSSAHPAPASPLCPSEDGTTLWFSTTTDQGAGLMKLPLGARAEPVLVLQQAGLREPVPNPRRSLVLWRSVEDSLWLCQHDGANLRRLDTPAGTVRQAMWNPDGQGVLYLHEPAAAGESVAIREQEVDSRADRLVAKTSQYACFARNANATVFVGASRSKAGPFVLLLLRITHRELALCEHRSRDASASSLAFSPDSQRLLFQGDAEGKPVVYSMHIEKLVEKTEA
jgi:oligogalacturonide lyase